MTVPVALFGLLTTIEAENRRIATSASDECAATGGTWIPSCRLALAFLRAYAPLMREIAKWGALLFIAFVAVSPIFEVFDKTDSFAQDTFDFARYALCLFCFLAFALRRHVICLRPTLLRKWILGPMHQAAVERHFSTTRLRGTTDRALFLTLHDLRI